jgi:uncharacterized RDD family membrane protein YckC
MSTYRVRPAGFISRFIAFIIDLIIIFLSITLIVFFVGLISDFFNLNNIISNWLGNGKFQLYVQTGTKIFAGIFSYLFSLLYQAFFWSLTGQTPGKFLLGLKVVRTNSKRLGFWRAFARALGYYLSAIILFLGFIWIIFDNRRQALHDKIVGTLVIYV